MPLTKRASHGVVKDPAVMSNVSMKVSCLLSKTKTLSAEIVCLPSWALLAYTEADAMQHFSRQVVMPRRKKFSGGSSHAKAHQH